MVCEQCVHTYLTAHWHMHVQCVHNVYNYLPVHRIHAAVYLCTNTTADYYNIISDMQKKHLDL